MGLMKSYNRENQYKTGHFKYKTPEERKRIFKQVCDHLKEGYSFDAFPYLSRRAIIDYCDKFPEDFPSELLQEAIHDGRLEWEKIGKNGTVGKLDGFKEKTYQFIMMNKYDMAINQKSDVNVKANMSVAEMSDDELKDLVGE